MAILNTQTRIEGNKAYPAMANIHNDLGAIGPGSTLQTNVETFDQDGASLGIQGLLITVDSGTPGYDDEIGGIELYELMRQFCRAIDDQWDPTVSCWATKVSNNMARFNIQPQGSNGLSGGNRVNYELARIRDWVYVPAPLAP